MNFSAILQWLVIGAIVAALVLNGKNTASIISSFFSGFNGSLGIVSTQGAPAAGNH